MKLVLKNKQEIEIAGMNNSFSFEKFKDGKGNELSYNSLITMYVGAVSYTHLDVYKRQRLELPLMRYSLCSKELSPF